MTDRHFVFGGASITDSPWLTWKDFVLARYGIRDSDLCAFKGVGNEFICWSVLAKATDKSFVCVMFTSIDKWDWMVSDRSISASINQQERHKVVDLDGNVCNEGFWCTGSWFPGHKIHYRENYFSLTYSLVQTLEKIFFLQTLFETRMIPHLFMFDSPILECTEQDLLNETSSTSLLDLRHNQYVKWWYDQIDWNKIYQPGLIGYCKENNLPWRNHHIGTHPPSSSHLKFCQDRIFPVLDTYLTPVETDLSWQAEKFDQLWHKN